MSDVDFAQLTKRLGWTDTAMHVAPGRPKVANDGKYNLRVLPRKTKED